MFLYQYEWYHCDLIFFAIKITIFHTQKKFDAKSKQSVNSKKYYYRLDQQKCPRIPLLTKLNSTADQVILNGNLTTFDQVSSVKLV
jgi:hypothetical protein